jgi:hypothetical protein
VPGANYLIGLSTKPSVAMPPCRPLCERAGMHVAAVDLPAFVAGFRISSAGELGHRALNRAPATAQIVEGWLLRKAPGIVCRMRDNGVGDGSGARHAQRHLSLGLCREGTQSGGS